jgi:predicted enzyme related to lactoylglutathione lyase
VKTINISHVIYPVVDPEKSIAFLTGMLGFYEQRRGEVIYAGLGDTLLELVDDKSLPGPAEAMAPYVFGLAVANLDEALAEVEKAGIEVIRPPWQARSFWGRQAVIKDPGGRGIALREWRPPDGPHFNAWTPEAD